MKSVDFLIETKHLYTMAGDGVGYRENHIIAVADGKIVAVGPKETLLPQYAGVHIMDATDKLVLPGFIDGHMHARHGFCRGVAQDLRQNAWMMQGVGPFEDFSDDEAKTLSARVTIGETILNGTTTIGDDGPDEHTALRVIDDFGVRGNVSVRIRDAVQRVYAPDELYAFDDKVGQKSLDDCLRLFEQYDGRDDGRIRVRFGPQGCDFVSRDMLQEVKRLSKARRSKIHMHLQQGSRETVQMERRYGCRSIPMLAGMGYLDSDFVGIHLADASDEEIRTVAESGAAMILCSNSIGIIRGEIPSARLFQDCGGRVGLGTDQCAGNNCHNMIAEMKMTAILNKCKYHDPAVMPAWKVLRMATIEGAQAIGIDDVTGSIEVGKDADIIFIDLNRSTMSPLYTVPMRNMVPNLVYSARGNEVDTVMVRGKLLVENGKPLTFDLQSAVADIQRIADRIGPLAAPKFWSIHGENAGFMEAERL